MENNISYDDSELTAFIVSLVSLEALANSSFVYYCMFTELSNKGQGNRYYQRYSDHMHAIHIDYGPLDRAD